MRSNVLSIALIATLGLSSTAALGGESRYVKQGTYLNGRAGPGTGYAKEHVLPPGTLVEILSSQNGWLQVKTPEGLILWVFGQYVSDKAPVKQRATPAPQAKQPPGQQARPQGQMQKNAPQFDAKQGAKPQQPAKAKEAGKKTQAPQAQGQGQPKAQPQKPSQPGAQQKCNPGDPGCKPLLIPQGN